MSNLRVSGNSSLNTRNVMKQSKITEDTYILSDTYQNIQKIIDIEQLRNNNLEEDNQEQIQSFLPTNNLLISQNIEQQSVQVKSQRSFSESVKRARTRRSPKSQTSLYQPIKVPSKSPINQQQSFKHEITEFLDDFYGTQSQIIPLSSRAVSLPGNSVKSLHASQIINNTNTGQINKNHGSANQTDQLNTSYVYIPQEIGTSVGSKTSEYIDEMVKSRLQNNVNSSSSGDRSSGQEQQLQSQISRSFIKSSLNFPQNSQLFANQQQPNNNGIQTQNTLNNNQNQKQSQIQQTDIHIQSQNGPKYTFLNGSNQIDSLQQPKQQLQNSNLELHESQQIAKQLDQLRNSNIYQSQNDIKEQQSSIQNQSLTQSQMSLSQYVEQNKQQYQYEEQQIQERMINAIKLIQDKYRSIGFKTQIFVSLRVLNGLSQKYNVLLNGLTKQNIIFQTPYCGLQYEECINNIRHYFYKVIYAAIIIKYKYMFTRIQLRSVDKINCNFPVNQDKYYYFQKLASSNFAQIKSQIYNSSIFYTANIKRYFQNIKKIQKYVRQQVIKQPLSSQFVQQRPIDRQSVYNMDQIVAIQKIFKKINVSRQIKLYAFIYYNIFQLDKLFFKIFMSYVQNVLIGVYLQQKILFMQNDRFMLFQAVQFNKQLNVIKNYIQQKQMIKNSVLKIQRCYRSKKQYNKSNKFAASKLSSIYNTNRIENFNDSDFPLTDEQQNQNNTKETLLKAFEVVQRPFVENDNQMHLTASLLIYGEIEKYLLDENYQGPYTAAEIIAIMVVDDIFTNVVHAVRHSSEQLRPKAFTMLTYFIEFNTQVYVKHQEQLNSLVNAILKKKSYYCVCQAKFIKKLTKLNKKIISEKDGKVLMQFYIRIKKLLNNLDSQINEKHQSNKQVRDQQNKQYKLLLQLRQHIKGILYYSQQQFQ